MRDAFEFNLGDSAGVCREHEGTEGFVDAALTD
jgi:hypothetical protein